MFARTVMDTRFHYLHPWESIPAAVQAFKAAGESENRKIFGMMVIDDDARLVGMVSMYDILLYLRPKHIRVLGEMDDMAPDLILESMVRRIKDIRISDIMTTDLVTVSPDTHLFMVMELMLRKHIRRLPVVENGKVLGMIYRSDLFDHLMDTIIKA